MLDLKVGSRWALLAPVLLGIVGLAEVAQARCGDSAGDFEAVAAVRAEVASTCDCDGAETRRDYVRCAREVVKAAVEVGSLPRQCTSTAMRCARKSTCGRKPGFVPCCRTNRRGVTRCAIKSSISRCRPPSGGTACASSFARSCCDACTNGGCVQPTPTPTATPRPTPTPPQFCESLLGLPALAQVPVSVVAGSPDCGGEHFLPPPEAPFTGRVDDADGAKLADLGLGCLYAGTLPPSRLASDSTSVLDVVGIGLPTIVLRGSEGSGPLDCTKGAGPGKRCANGAAGTDGQGTCEVDGDCNGGSGTCLLEPNCYFGPPSPVNGTFPTCAMNALHSDICGSLDTSTFETNLAVTISTRVFVTFNPASPCPLCSEGVCTYGKRAGLPCTPQGNFGTSPECPPADSQFLAALQVVIPNLTTGTSSLTGDTDGFFCDDQVIAGAIGLPEARTVTQVGQGVAGGGTSGESTLVGTFCIYPSGNPVIDITGGFPAVGTLSARSSIDLTGILLP